MKLVSENLADLQVTRLPVTRNDDTSLIELGVTAEYRGQCYVASSLLREPTWAELTEAQRESTWKRVEALLRDHISGKALTAQDRPGQSVRLPARA